MAETHAGAELLVNVACTLIIYFVFWMAVLLPKALALLNDELKKRGLR